MSSDQYQNDDTVNRVAVISPPTRKKCTKLTNSPLSAHISNSMSCHTPRSTIDNAWRQQYLCESQSLLKLYMNSDYFEVDTSHNHMPIRVTPERMYRRMDRSVRIKYKWCQAEDKCIKIQCISSPIIHVWILLFWYINLTSTRQHNNRIHVSRFMNTIPLLKHQEVVV